MTTIGLIGAGHIGSTVAKAAVMHGYTVLISNAAGPQSLGSLVADIGGDLRAATIREAATQADIVLVAIPFRNYTSLPPDAFVGKIVIDANNYFPQRDGSYAALDDHVTTSSELVAEHLVGARLVKAFNSIDAAELITDAKPAGDPGRRGMALAGDDADAKAVVAGFIDDLGFDPVDLGDLAQGWRSGPGSLVFVQHLDAGQVRAKAAKSSVGGPTPTQ